jgi:hypothetical protein
MAKNNSYPDPFNENDDWVEIYNPNDYAVDIADMYLTDSHYSNGVTVLDSNTTPAIRNKPQSMHMAIL